MSKQLANSLSYDKATNQVKLNGVVTKDYQPTFIPNGISEPTLFGFTKINSKEIIDIKGNIHKIVDKDSIGI